MNRGLGTAMAGVFMAAGLSIPAEAADPAPTRILIVGDSVTQGDAGDYTWRYFSACGLEKSGAEVDFVGQHTGTFGGGGAENYTGGYANPNFDQDHAARWGLLMFEMLNQPSDSAPTITDLMTAQQPDVLVEMLGLNDFMWLSNFDAAKMNGQVRRFVADARSVKPNVDVVLASLPQTWVSNVPAYNEGLPALAAELSTADSRVVASPVPDFTEGTDTYDRVHPTTAGQVKIAAAVSVALEELGIGQARTMPLPATPGPHDPPAPPPPPPPPPPPTPTPAPQPDPVVEPTTTPPPVVPPVSVPATVPAPAFPTEPQGLRAKRVGERTVVRWREATAATSYVVRCATRSKTTIATTATLRATPRRCKVRSVNAAGSSAWVVVRVRA
ncbi:GDSL-type esterase/lipase family protein [Nocardioides sp.]|uniref:GDSL-type esterase/lipase family protein n=1 Tax=Nocardioides sp. TaxID=35761 RepID=UPI002CFC4BCF|nr:GDSL-type esterase/lipase family protein [Nocardioides sp.]HXH79186.1 GDSL-type esterase/lipase family protein [Nocardioides sp.]